MRVSSSAAARRRGTRSTPCLFLRATVLLSVAVLAAGAQQNPGRGAAAAPADPGWPRIYSDGNATLALHQPQVDEWKDFKLVRARSAVEVIPQKGAQKAIGAVHWEATSEADLTARTVILTDIRITSFRVPSLDEAKSQELEAVVRRLMPLRTNAIALDRVITYLETARTEVREVAVSMEPPPILVSTSPAILVMIDGQPILGEIKGTQLTFVVNTNWDVIKENGGDFYLLNGTQWMTAENLEGPWKAAAKLPKEFKKIPADENWKDVKKALPLKKDNAKTAAAWVFVTQKPSELILIEGQAKFVPIEGTNLSDVVNTKSNLFYHNVDKHYYFLTSGRWFRNQQLRGNWEAATDKLPADFRNIPRNHARAHVLASVPGTVEAKDAVMLASVPQSAAVNRKQAAAQAQVTYVGNPEFKPISGTSLHYAANTPADVIQHGDKYYLLQEGVWFVSGSPNGPWEVADTIPQEIYKIPPESPKHNTTYVYVTDSDQDTVTTAYTAGYTGVTIAFGVAMWGTGWYYPPYYYWGPMYPYPIYWPMPYYTYGVGAWYNPATGAYGRAAVAYGPYGGYGRAAAYNPVTGGYTRRAAAWGPYQAAMGTTYYNPRTGTWGAGYRYANPYQGWGEGVVRRGDQWAAGRYYYDERGAVGGIKTSEGGRLIAAGDGDSRGMIGKTSDGDLYVGKDGDVYKRDQSGNWYQHGEGGWDQIDQGDLSPEQQQRVEQARSKAEGVTPEQRQQASSKLESARASSGTAATTRQQPAQTGTGTREATRQPGQLATGSGRQPGQLATESGRQPGTLAAEPRLDPGSFSRDTMVRPTDAPTQRGAAPTSRGEVMGGLGYDASARTRGNQRYDSWRSSGGGRSATSRSYSGGGMRRGGGGRRR